jgi:glycerol-3-phosphate cytidylyltransferase
LSSDEFNNLKNKKSFYSYEERKFLLESIKYVDEIISENDWKQKKEDIKKY